MIFGTLCKKKYVGCLGRGEVDRKGKKRRETFYCIIFLKHMKILSVIKMSKKITQAHHLKINSNKRQCLSFSLPFPSEASLSTLLLILTFF